MISLETFFLNLSIITSRIGSLNTYFFPFITFIMSTRVNISPIFKIMPSAPASRASTHNFSFNISPVNTNIFTFLYCAFVFLHNSTPIVVFPCSPKSNNTRSGCSLRNNLRYSPSFWALPITTASGTSVLKRPSVPFISSGTSSTIITLNLSIVLSKIQKKI